MRQANAVVGERRNGNHDQEVERYERGWIIRFRQNANGTWLEVERPNEGDEANSAALAVLQGLRHAMVIFVCMFLFIWVAALIAKHGCF